MYEKMYPSCKIMWISRFYSEARNMVINGEEYLSLKSILSRSAAIVAKWFENGGINEDGNVPKRFALITFFLHHN